MASFTIKIPIKMKNDEAKTGKNSLNM